MLKVLILLFVSLELFSNDLNLQNILNKIESKKLYNNTYWLKLLHYENNKSIIEEDSFFLSNEGKYNPKNELIKTIEFFNKNNKYICKYPARYKWLNSKLNLNLKTNQCKKLNKFLSSNFKKISFIFTSERYNSPSSVFGHSFLKLETNTIPYAIDYTAQVDDDPNLFTYAYKGINGKYLSKFKLLPYKNKDYEYKDEEFRDLFNLELDLTKDQINNILIHLYEIKNTTNKYYYLSRNCSSRLIYLLDLADPTFNLYNQLYNPTLPIQSVYLLKKSNLIKNTKIEISKMKQFVLLTDQLNRLEKKYLKNIILGKISIYDFYHNININKKNIIILSAIKYFEIESAKGNFNTKHIQPLLKLIKLKNKYKLQSNIKETKKIDQIPISKYTKRVTIGNNHDINNNEQLTLGFRYLYKNKFDLIDNYQKNGSVELFDLSIRKIKDEYSIDYLTLLNLEAIPISNDFFIENTNKITLGLKRLYKSDKLYSYFHYGLGYKYKFYKNTYIHIYPYLGIYHNNSIQGLGAIETSINTYNNNFANQLKYTYNNFTDINQQHIYTLNSYFKINKSLNLNFSTNYIVEKEKYNNYSIKLNYYF